MKATPDPISSRLRLIEKKAQPEKVVHVPPRREDIRREWGENFFQKYSPPISSASTVPPLALPGLRMPERFPRLNFTSLRFLINVDQPLNLYVYFVRSIIPHASNVVFSVPFPRERERSLTRRFFLLSTRETLETLLPLLSPFSIIVSLVEERMGMALLFPCYVERLVFVFRVIGSFVVLPSFFTFPVLRGTRGGNREASDPVRSMCFPGEGEILIEAITVIARTCPCTSQWHNPKSFSRTWGHLQTCARHFQWR